MIRKYFFSWYMMASNAAAGAFVSRWGAVVLILGKFVRFGFFLFFLFILGTKTKVIAGYTFEQMLLFFLTFQLVDVLPQLFFREVYRFRGYIVSGDFDFFLLKPISPLFRGLFGGSDILDLPMVLLSGIALVFVFLHMPSVHLGGVVLYLLLVANAFVIAMSLHILVLALGVVSTEVDNAIMFYRDLTQMGRFPVDIYTQPLRGFLTFVVPVGIMMTVPAQAVMGVLSWGGVLIALGIAGMFLSGSLLLWNYALRSYSSASS